MQLTGHHNTGYRQVFWLNAMPLSSISPDCISKAGPAPSPMHTPSHGVDPPGSSGGDDGVSDSLVLYYSHPLPDPSSSEAERRQ